MFYDHEVLTSRQHGVATIWLVATLGYKSNLKRVTRRAILDVNLPKACKTITEPEMPLALRLQGSLLYGVSRVYSQQCGYVLADVTSLKDKMRGTGHLLKDMALDPDVGNTRPEQLNLMEDPGFIPDLDMIFDLSAFAITPGSSSRAGSASPQTFASSQTSLGVHEEEEPVLELHSLDTPGDFGGFNVNIGAGTSSAVMTGSKAGQGHDILGEESAFIDEPMFDVDETGALQLAVQDDPQPALPAEVETQDAVLESTEAVGTGDPRHMTPVEHANEDGSINYDIDNDVVMAVDDEPGQEAQLEMNLGSEDAGNDIVPPNEHSSSPSQPTDELSDAVEAPQRRARAVKPLRPDQRTELSNRELSDWNQNYLVNMLEALRNKEQHMARFGAKKAADYWVHGQGIGNVASTFGNDRIHHPLAIFSGQSLWDMLTGVVHAAGRKRSRSDSTGDVDSQDEARRVRAKTVPEEAVARGEDDDGLVIHGDDSNIESEVGRQAPPSLQDQWSDMPWNISASRQSSAQPLGSGGVFPRLSSSVGGAAAGMELLGPPSAFTHRGSRLTTASPLLGRGLSRLGSLGAHDASRLTGDGSEYADLDQQLGGDFDADFELYGPSAAVDTQTAAQSQWIAATLENEAYNFLAFVNTKMQEKMERQLAEAEEDAESFERDVVTFDELLPPAQNSQVVGAQALLHVLTLATKGLLVIDQGEAFGAVEILLVNQDP